MKCLRAFPQLFDLFIGGAFGAIQTSYEAHDQHEYSVPLASNSCDLYFLDGDGDLYYGSTTLYALDGPFVLSK